MKKSDRLVNYLADYVYDLDDKRVIQKQFPIPELPYLKLREYIWSCGRVISEFPDENVLIAVIRSGFFRMNKAILVIRLLENTAETVSEDGTGKTGMELAGYANEGFIRQHTVENAVNRLMKAIENGQEQDKWK